MKIWLIYFESANYCGYGQHCLVQAETDDEAREIAFYHCNEVYYEEDYDQFVEEHGSDEDVGAWANIQTCEELTPEHESWSFTQDPGQASFYPKLNF